MGGKLSTTVDNKAGMMGWRFVQRWLRQTAQMKHYKPLMNINAKKQ